jgi:hypothetical protein
LTTALVPFFRIPGHGRDRRRGTQPNSRSLEKKITSRPEPITAMSRPGFVSLAR